MTTPIAVTIRTASDMLEVSERTIRDAINAKALPARKVGRAIRVEVSDLTDWFRSLDAA